MHRHTFASASARGRARAGSLREFLEAMPALICLRLWRSLPRVNFVETPAFTRRVLQLMDDERYSALQAYLAKHPDAGKVIPGSGGLRKVRWAGSGRGKRGGLRPIYYWWLAKDRISMLLVYPKHEQDDLSTDQVKQLRKALEV